MNKLVKGVVATKGEVVTQRVVLTKMVVFAKRPEVVTTKGGLDQKGVQKKVQRTRTSAVKQGRPILIG